MIGAPPKKSAKRCGSIVAEVMMTRSSGRCGSRRFEHAEQEVDVEAALVRLVDDQRVVAAQQAIVLQLAQQDAVRHQLDARVRSGAVGEAHLEADGTADARPQLLREARGNRARRDAPRLRVTDQPERCRDRPRDRSSAAASSCRSPSRRRRR